MSVSPIDLFHGSAERVIGSYLLETEEGPALSTAAPPPASKTCAAVSRNAASSSETSDTCCFPTSISTTRARRA